MSAVFLFLASVISVFGETADVDTGFNPQLTANVSSISGKLLMQSDGKIIIFGTYVIGENTSRTYVKRLNSDGSVDATFDCQECGSFSPRLVALQSDGKILIAGVHKLIRVNQNGSLDTSYNSPLSPSNLRCDPTALTAQPDNKTLIACPVSNSDNSVTRLNGDGSTDTSFTTILAPQHEFRSLVTKIVVQPDNKILVGGGRYGDYGNWINRYNSNGSLDNSFQSANLYSNGRISEIELQPDGKILIAGYFNIYRLNSNGSDDASFTAIPVGQNQFRQSAKFLADGRIYSGILYSNSFPTPSVTRLVRYTATGAIDGTFNSPIVDPADWTVDSAGRVIVSKNGFFRLNLDGTIDTSFNVNIIGDSNVTAVAVQSNGKMILGGEFSKANGINSGRIAKINQDGTTDTSFNSGSGFDKAPKDISIQADGKILVGGGFTSYNGIARAFVARLNADGSLDAAFNPTITFGTSTIFKYVSQIAYLPNGKIMIGGNFATVNGASRTMLAILNSDGTLDTTFNPAFTANPGISLEKIRVQANGQIMVGGYFGMKRFNGDGTLDSSFNYNIEQTAVMDFVQRADGKYFAAIEPHNGSIDPYIRLLNADGTIQYGFSATVDDPNGARINALFQQSNGNVIYGGRFLFAQQRTVNNIARVSENGASDLNFPRFGTNGAVSRIVGLPDGKALFVGDFTRIENVGRSGIARLTLGNRLTATLFDFDGDGRSDISVFRPSTNVWYSLLSGSSSVSIRGFGANGDIPVPADYDNDGKTDYGIFRPSTGDWIYNLSATNTVFQYNFGSAGDIPIPYMGTDRRARPAVFRPSNNTWWYNSSVVSFGAAGDKPLSGDFDGDGISDPAVYRPSTGVWWYAASSANNQHRATQWGLAEDIPAPGDYDGDGKTDLAVYRPSNNVWYILNSTGSYTIMMFGLAEDKPVPADYDGDGKTDIALYRPSTGVWYLLQSTAGFTALQWGISTDVPLPNAYIR